VGGRTILFGGDLGRYDRPVLPDPSPVSAADYLLVESTYGDRLHEPDDRGERLADLIRETRDRGGKLVVPAFAIGRVEELLYWLKRLEDEQRIPAMPVYVDSPMAIAALQYYAGRLNELDAELSASGGSDGAARAGAAGRADRPGESGGADRAGGPGRMGGAERSAKAANSYPAGAKRVAAFATRRLTLVTSPQQSADLVASRHPSIVIASSGMATGGRVLHHLAATLPSAKNTVLFAGFQAPGTRGRALVDGATEVKMFGRAVPVAARIERLESMSAHADAGEILRWLSAFSSPPRTTFLVHGEPGALHALAARIRTERGWPTHIPSHGERVAIDLA
jgi:metallo-beta-lactamase family protein